MFFNREKCRNPAMKFTEIQGVHGFIIMNKVKNKAEEALN